MIRNLLILASVLSALMCSTPVISADPDYPLNPWDNTTQHAPMHKMRGGEFDGPYFKPPAMRFDAMDLNDFPTASELARMAPPKPLSEEKIKKRFAAQRDRLQAMLSEDRQAAVRYAQDFSRYQKMQADNLAKLMASAEKRRSAILKRLDEQEQRALDLFRQTQSAQPEQADTAAEKPDSAM